MSRLLEMLMQRQAAEETAGPWNSSDVEPRDSAEKAPEPLAAAAKAGDPVLGSVMAQFEMLQEDFARRRKQSSDLQ